MPDKGFQTTAQDYDGITRENITTIVNFVRSAIYREFVAREQRFNASSQTNNEVSDASVQAGEVATTADATMQTNPLSVLDTDDNGSTRTISNHHGLGVFRGTTPRHERESGERSEVPLNLLGDGL